MKSRSHRLPASSVYPKDDWVEESWTVDCVCGVNFDDGEEMVNCDECGVWVHTSCSHYVKTDKSFVCDKCKNNPHHNNNNHHNHSHHLENNDSKETEVAQLLVELPSKTLRIDNPLPPPHPPSYRASAFPPSPRPVRPWTDIPIEDRVHVQGVPGGDPALFSGLSSVFGPQLWKCTGYIPKKFNFRYQEFPCWDEEVKVLDKDFDRQIKKNIDDSVDDNSAAAGAGVLFFSAKLDVPPPAAAVAAPSPTVNSDSEQKQAKDSKGSKGFVYSKETVKLEGDNSEVLTMENEVSKDRSLLKPSVMHFGNRRKEDLGNSKEKSGKKRIRIVEKDGNYKKKTWLHNPDRGPMAIQVDTQCAKGGNSSSPLPTNQLSLDPGAVDHAIDVQKSNLEENGRHQVPQKLKEPSKALLGMPSFLRNNFSVAVPVKEEVFGVTSATTNVFEGELLPSGGTDLQKSEQVREDVTTAGPETEDHRNAPDTRTNMIASCVEIHAKSKTELANGSRNTNVKLSSPHDAKLGLSAALFQSKEIAAYCSENVGVNDAITTVLEARDRKVEDVGRRSEVVDMHRQRADGESPLDLGQPKLDSASLDCCFGTKKFSAGFDSNAALESNKSSVTVPAPRVATGEGKISASPVSTVSASSAILMPSSASETCSSLRSENDNVDGKQKRAPEFSFTDDVTEGLEGEGRHDKGGKLMKELPKSALGCVPKSSQLKKLSHAATVSKRMPDSKDSMLDSSSSATPMPPVASLPVSELANVQQTESALNIQKMGSTMQNGSASNIQKKVTGSFLSHKCEKINQSVPQSSSKVNNTLTQAAASSNSHSTLSDEELALLLHQELNSSPRVPRVPRMRHAGSLPQLASPTTTSMLMKRTSSVGGKDHGLVFRRKGKDLEKANSHGYGEMDDEVKKMERVSSSIYHRRQDSSLTSDSVSKREADSGSANGMHSMKKSNAVSKTAASSSLLSPAEGNESNFLATRLSPRIPDDDEKAVVGRLTHRTLPGLLAEIMSEGKRMTYEELCNSVLPHWPYLRKHNGERYAYSSHSQAVLDCLRNRNEWARLVDRGPKTSGGRKRRKDVGNAGVESEDNDDSRDRITKDGSRTKTVESHHEEFPKGKRKARKRRRLALQGRGIKDVKKRRRTNEGSDDEDGSFSSDSSEETTLSEDEIQGSGMSAVGNDVSANSDGTENI